MNKLIKKFAEQADQDYTGIYDDYMGHALVGNEAIEKFAELIVRECAQVAEEVDGDSRARKCVLEHFGVEE